MIKFILALTTVFSLSAFAQIEPGTAPESKLEGSGTIQNTAPADLPMTQKKHKAHKVKKSHHKKNHKKKHKKVTQ